MKEITYKIKQKASLLLKKMVLQFEVRIYQVTSSIIQYFVLRHVRKEYVIIEKIYGGKDGDIFIGHSIRTGQKVVIKILSLYAKKYLPITIHVNSLDIKSEHLYKLQIHRKSYIAYEFETLTNVNTEPEAFLKVLKQLCEIEVELLEKGVCFWDFGFTNHTNYMISKEDVVKIIDYGGNGFLLIENNNITVKNHRKNLVIANSEFLKSQFFLHILYQGLGKKTRFPLASLAQSASREELKEIQNQCARHIDGTLYSKILNDTENDDYLDIQTWHKIIAIIDNLQQTHKYMTQESADISSISYKNEEVIVSGYQNFKISKNRVEPFQHKDRRLWDTEKKFTIVQSGLQKILAKTVITTFADVGSNLGLYVFLAAIEFHIQECTGYDYNKEYIEECEKIARKFNLTNCFFKQSLFNELSEPHDCVLAMGLIHHLYHRTESHGSLEIIMRKFSKLTKKYCIVEFPTESDEKAKKWTSMPGRKVDELYSLDNFLKASHRYFKSVELIGSIGETRSTFLLEK